MQLSVNQIDWTQLNDAERFTLEEIVPRWENGYSAKEIAEQLGLEPRDVERAHEDLAAKVAALAGVVRLPPLTDEEYEALKASITEHGQQVPILIGSPTSGKPGEIVDGSNRERICRQLKLAPKYQDVDGTAEQLHALGLVLNLARRQLSTSSRRGIIKAELLRDASRSNRAIAANVGVSHNTVEAVRRELERTGEVVKLTTRTGKDGVDQPIRATSTTEPPKERSVRVIVATDQFEQLVGPWVTCKAFRLVERRPGVHELQVQLVDVAPASSEQMKNVATLARELAGFLEQPRFLEEFLGDVGEVFGRPIAHVEELHVDEADWALERLMQMASRFTAAA